MKISQELTTRMDAALMIPDPLSSLLDLMQEVVKAGALQLELYCFVTDFRDTIDPQTEAYDMCSEVLDIIWSGGWGGRNALFAHELSNEEVAAWKATRSSP